MGRATKDFGKTISQTVGSPSNSPTETVMRANLNVDSMMDTVRSFGRTGICTKDTGGEER